MIRKQAVLTVFSVSALLVTSMLQADPIGAPDRALPEAQPIHKLLNSRVVSRMPSDFERGMDRQIIARNEIASLQSVLDGKLSQAAASRRAVDTSA